ncbi:MAG: glutathione binding-like protein [Burkholderiales bacterium]
MCRWLDWENNELLPPQHELVMQLVRLPQHERDSTRLEQARQAFIKPLRIAEDQLGRTRYIAGDRFTYGDIPLGVRVHRWYLLPLERPEMPHLERWYANISARPAFHKWTAPPEYHREG